MTFSEGNTFNQEQLNGRGRSWFSTVILAASFSPIKQMGWRGDSGRQYARQSHWCGGRKQSMFGSSKVLRVWLPYSTSPGELWASRGLTPLLSG